MLGNSWSSSRLAAEKLGISEIGLSYLRSKGLLKPGIHWKSSPYSQTKPWNPEAVYNIKRCKEFMIKNSNEQYDIFAA